MKFLLSAGMAFLTLTLVLSASSADPDPVIYYSFDNFTTVVPDESGRGNDGTVVGDVTPAGGGKRGGGANVAPSDIPVEAMTLCAWAKPENTGDHHEIFNARAADSTWIVHPELRSDGTFRWLLRSAGGSTIFDIRAGAWTADEWIHFGGVYDSTAGMAKLYLNAEEVSEAPGDAIRIYRGHVKYVPPSFYV